ncbi:MAG: tetratricopeptide repeat protein, partial [Caldilineaceae bacterium]|nr:tetratricopeptide repeat protein [Caldilineaceae bacterium]
MLTKDEQDALQRLSVFRGEFSRAAAEAVTGVSLLTMAALVEKSLLQTVHRGYYQMHELLRQYSAERLQAQKAEEEEIRDRHAGFYCGYLERRSAELQCGRQQNALMALNHERANLQSAWERATARRNLAQIARAMDGLGRYYEWTGNLTGGAAAFALIGDDLGYPADGESRRTQAHALAWAANFERMSGRTDVAKEQLTQSHALLDELAAAGVDVRRQRALALLHQGHLLQPSDLDAAAQAYRRSGEYYQEIGLRWEAATADAWLGETARVIGYTGQAIALLRRAQTVFDEYGDQRSVAMVLENIARAYLLDRADLDLALETAQASLELRRRSGDRVGIATTLLAVSYVHCWLNQPEAAKPLVEEALAIARELGHRAVECEAHYIAMVVFNYLEAAEQKREIGERGLALAREMGDVPLMGNFLRSLGNQALIRGDYQTAHAMHVEAFEIQAQAGIQVMLPWLHVVRAYSSWKIGMLDDAHDHISAALRASVERSDAYTAVHALLFVAQVVATQGDLTRAVEIGATAHHASLWQKS